MEQKSLTASPAPALLQRQSEQELASLRRSAGILPRFGLALAEPEMRELIRHHAEILQQTGRVEIGEGILPQLIDAFCDSPYLSRESCAETFDALQELFYRCKSDSRDTLSDEALLRRMKELFNGRAQGSLQYLEDSLFETIRRSGHTEEDR